MTDELKPCPFCGSDVEFYVEKNRDHHHVFILCKSCPIFYYQDAGTLEINFATCEMTKVWNQRANDDDR
ncbi:Lar family restriction alleviation protein [Xenorhabdus budapestensis]|uniref:Lar family restriction alleviation protein n=1 Tax=Xenorhabdus budapestensis TaxID=290110 RepID=A0ABX7VGP0_XENBU|nr:Lar family restriction alleviation protein [Xenorhabdus budapestensis]